MCLICTPSVNQLLFFIALIYSKSDTKKKCREENVPSALRGWSKKNLDHGEWPKTDTAHIANFAVVHSILRIIYDHIKKCGGVMKVIIDQDLRNAAKQASSNYRTEQRRQQEAEKK